MQLLEARLRGPFRDPADLAVRSGLDQGALQALAEADACACFGLNRQEVAWIFQGLWIDAPLFAGILPREESLQLPAPGELDEIRADYRSVGLSVSRHPMDVFRSTLVCRGVRRCGDLARAAHGESTRVAGLVANRQRPGTANGVVFMTLEDETGMANLVVWPRVWERYRRIARRSSMVGVSGTVQRDGEAVSVLVSSFWLLQSEPVVSARSRDFR